MKKILIFIGGYLPGHKYGGPLTTVKNLTEALGDEYQFFIVCPDRDLGEEKPYSDIVYNEWNTVGKAKVWYIKPNGFTFKMIRQTAEEFDLIYSCGFYDDYAYKTLILNKFGKLHGKPVVIASMGVFSKGALAQKALKKKVFITVCKVLGLFKKIKWSVTSELEASDIRNIIGNKAECIIAEDMPRTDVPGIAAEKKYNGTLKIAFPSRISPKKNLLGAIKSLAEIKKEIFFTIYGPKEDKDYWTVCEKELKKLPDNIHWNYAGDLPSQSVQEALQCNDVFLFPTFGENYGHVIFEALSVGCIPVISDQTPWGIIATEKAGYVLNLTEDMKAFTDKVNELCEMSARQRRTMAENAVRLAEEKVKKSKKETGYRNIFG